jgi:hypothetical protein
VEGDPTPAAEPPDKVNLSVDDGIGKYVAAIGGHERVHNIRTLIPRGEYREGGAVATDGALVKMRPRYKLVGDPKNPNPEFSEGYDGSAWEYYRDPGIVLRTVGPSAAASRHGSWIDRPLIEAGSENRKITGSGPACPVT